MSTYWWCFTYLPNLSTLTESFSNLKFHCLNFPKPDLIRACLIADSSAFSRPSSVVSTKKVGAWTPLLTGTTLQILNFWVIILELVKHYVEFGWLCFILVNISIPGRSRTYSLRCLKPLCLPFHHEDIFPSFRDVNYLYVVPTYQSSYSRFWASGWIRTNVTFRFLITNQVQSTSMRRKPVAEYFFKVEVNSVS